MIMNTENYCSNELRKIGLLLTFATGNYGINENEIQISVNQNSGNTWIWCEDWNFSLFIRVCGDDVIEVCYSDPKDGEEFFIDAPTNIQGIYDFIAEIQKGKESGEDLSAYR